MVHAKTLASRRRGCDQLHGSWYAARSQMVDQKYYLEPFRQQREDASSAQCDGPPTEPLIWSAYCLIR